MTKSQRIRESAVMISSTMPSLKYSCSGSPLMFWNGKTEIDGLSGRESVDFVDVPLAGSEELGVSPSRTRWTRTGRAMLTPWQSGAVDREQGVSKAGNPRLRTKLIQLAWLWLRNQPHSALSVLFHERVSRNGGRLRKTTIVALARKLLVALWKYVTAGVVIEGAAMTTA